MRYGPGPREGSARCPRGMLTEFLDSVLEVYLTAWVTGRRRCVPTHTINPSHAIYAPYIKPARTVTHAADMWTRPGRPIYPGRADVALRADLLCKEIARPASATRTCRPPCTTIIMFNLNLKKPENGWFSAASELFVARLHQQPPEWCLGPGPAVVRRLRLRCSHPAGGSS